MFELGLKLWSTNDNYINDAIRLFDKGIYHYIELYVVPESYGDYINKWKEIIIPYVIHASHSGHGLNLARRDCLQKNMIMSDEARKYADKLNADVIIFHPGVDGSIEETVFQLNELHESRMIVENKPYYSIYDRSICNGYSYEDIMYVMENTGAGFCLDLGHAICAANALRIDPLESIFHFNKLKPHMYHISDGYYDEIEDRHLHFGKGDFQIKYIKNIFHESCMITIETEKDFNDRLDDFEHDVKYFRNI